MTKKTQGVKARAERKPSIGHEVIRPDGSVIRYVREEDDDQKPAEHYRTVDTLALMLRNGSITGAMHDAGLNPEDIGYINAHGTGTAANDKTECAAVAHAFGHHVDRLMISSTKSMHGHLIGGTGAVELLACIMALRDGIIAPTIGYEEPDPECALDVVPNEAREARVEAVLSNAFAFGGLNAVIALRRV